jgi:carbon monoxide dehydrogenase subunit G
MALRCESSVTVAVPPEAAFPWLLDEDKVRRWVSGLQRYERVDSGPLRLGSRIHEDLTVSGYALKLELEVMRLEPPRRADLRFQGSGFKAVNEYAVAEAPGGARVTWGIEGDATSFKARLIVPMVQSKLQEKLDGDLARLRDLLASEPAAA